jgi:hypothetical protein
VLVVDVGDRLLRRFVLVRHQVFRKYVLEVAVDDVFQLGGGRIRLYDLELPLHALAILGLSLLLHLRVPARAISCARHGTGTRDMALARATWQWHARHGTGTRDMALARVVALAHQVHELLGQCDLHVLPNAGLAAARLVLFLVRALHRLQDVAHFLRRRVRLVHLPLQLLRKHTHS